MTDNYSFSNSIKGVFLSMDTEKKNEINNKFLAQNTENENINNIDAITDSDDIDSIEVQDSVDSTILSSKNDKTFQQCSSAGNIYSDKELNENLQVLDG
jgi:hypothetical protein